MIFEIIYLNNYNHYLVERSTVHTNDILVLGEKINDSLVVRSERFNFFLIKIKINKKKLKLCHHLYTVVLVYFFVVVLVVDLIIIIIVVTYYYYLSSYHHH